MTAAPSDVFWNRVRDLFQAAAELPSSDRAAFLDRECDDESVRAEVDSLLAAHDQTDGFLSRSVWDLIDAAEGERLAGAVIGQYRIVRPLGEGGMGTVFLAARDDTHYAQRVAIKLVRGAGAGEALVQRFRQERQILAALEHPNIARLLDGGTTTDGLPYLVMEYVDGTPIDAYCREHALSIREKLQLFLKLCDAVQYAHRSLVIHRDIKPANVLVTANGVPKLLDFGIAKLVSPEPERPGAAVTRLMTPEYASPEQFHGRPVTTATDVFSLGVLLFELLTGKTPFTITRDPSSEAPRASTSAKALRGDIDNILACALEVDPARRYGSVEKFADDIRRHLSGHPIAARPATLRYHASKFIRRNKLGVAAATAIAIVIAVAFAATLHQKRIAERRFDEVRSLARAVVFELHDAIAPLPGSTSARELLVRRALVYLDNLAAEAQRNTPLRIELAGAYLKIGDVQGLPYRANLGDSQGALKSYRKALAIAQEVRDDEPENGEALNLLADAHDRIGAIQQRALRWPEALRAHETARELRESVAQRTPREDLALARIWVAIGDDRYVGGHALPRSLLRGTPKEAYENALRILAKVPPDGPHRADLLMERGRAHQRLGGMHTGLKWRDMPAALAHHAAALRALEERANLDPADAVARRNFADQIVMLATAQNAFADGAAALEGTTRALVILKELADADPKNVEAQHDLAFVHEQMGFACSNLKRWDDAERALREAIAIRERLVAADPGNQEDRRGVGSLYGALAKIYRDRGDPAAAARFEAKSRSILDALRASRSVSGGG